MIAPLTGGATSPAFSHLVPGGFLNNSGLGPMGNFNMSLG